MGNNLGMGNNMMMGGQGMNMNAGFGGNNMMMGGQPRNMGMGNNNMMMGQPSFQQPAAMNQAAARQSDQGKKKIRLRA